MCLPQATRTKRLASGLHHERGSQGSFPMQAGQGGPPQRANTVARSLPSAPSSARKRVHHHSREGGTSSCGVSLRSLINVGRPRRRYTFVQKPMYNDGCGDAPACWCGVRLTTTPHSTLPIPTEQWSLFTTGPATSVGIQTNCRGSKERSR